MIQDPLCTRAAVAASVEALQRHPGIPIGRGGAVVRLAVSVLGPRSSRRPREELQERRQQGQARWAELQQWRSRGSTRWQELMAKHEALEELRREIDAHSRQ